MPEKHRPLITISRRNLRELEQLREQLRAQGLEWLTIDDVLQNLGAVDAWRQGVADNADPADGAALSAHARLLELCVQARWPMPSEHGRDHTTPAAMAVFYAKERLAEAMLGDHRAGAGANTIASRAGNACSRPVALKILASMRLLDDAGDALAPLFDAGVPVALHQDKDRSVLIFAFWEDEDDTTRQCQLDDVQQHLDAAGLALRNPSDQSPATARDLIAGDRELELHRAG